MATITVPPGRNGDLTLKGYDLYLEEWSMSLEIESEDYKHFNLTADDNSLYWRDLVTGFVGGTGSARGKFDNTSGSYLPTNKEVWMDEAGTGFLGYTATVGFIISYTITNIEAGQTTGTPAGATYACTFKITDCRFTNTGS